MTFIAEVVDLIKLILNFEEVLKPLAEKVLLLTYMHGSYLVDYETHTVSYGIGKCE